MKNVKNVRVKNLHHGIMNQRNVLSVRMGLQVKAVRV